MKNTRQYGIIRMYVAIFTDCSTLLFLSTEWIVFMKNRKESFYNKVVKRALDIICSFVAIVFLSIIYLPICIVIKCTSEGPVFFKQKRVGKDKKYFNIFKGDRGIIGTTKKNIDISSVVMA